MRYILLCLLLPFSLFAEPVPKIEFVVIIPSYNNEKYVYGNIDSLAMQTYPHWKAIYVDDCSTDATLYLVEKHIRNVGLEDKIKVVHNKKNVGSMANCYKWISKQDPKKVIVHLDGDDRFAHPGVLQRLAEVYADDGVWTTYGNFIAEPDSFNYRCEALPQDVIETNSFRKYHWVTSHLKTYYAKLFHLIDKEHLCYKGDFVPMAQDQAIMLPVLEMASKGHIRFIDEVLYIYNYNNLLNDEKRDKSLGIDVVNSLRAIPPYMPLERLF